MAKLTKRYERAKFSNFTNEQIQLIAAALAKLEAEEGEVRVTRVAELARNPKYPLHDLVYADSQAIAAEKWRLEVVRRIIRSVRAVYVDDVGDEAFSTPMLVSVDRDQVSGEVVVKQRRYISTEKAYADPVIRQTLIDRALQQAEEWQERYRSIKELGLIFQAISVVKIERLQKRKGA